MSTLTDWVLSLDDMALAALYSEWSEETHAAGWLSYGPPLFAKAIATGGWKPHHSQPLEDYELEGVRAIRELLMKARDS